MLPSHSPTPITGLAEALGHKARQSPLLLPPWHQDPLCHQAMQSTTPKPTSTTSQQLPSIPQTARLVTISRIAVQQQQRRQRQCRSSASPICLAQTSSQFNPAINVMSIPDGPQFPPEVRNAVILTLDDSGNVHSIYRKDSAAVTGAYWYVCPAIQSLSQTMNAPTCMCMYACVCHDSTSSPVVLSLHLLRCRDALTMLPALTPPGPVAILGLGAGTIAHLVHHLYPERQMHGWELDAAVVAVAQEHMGMQALQDAGCLVSVLSTRHGRGKANTPFAGVSPASGVPVASQHLQHYQPSLSHAALKSPIRVDICVLWWVCQVVHVGDALAEDAAVEGGAAGIIVDLFANGQLIPQLTQVGAAAWTVQLSSYISSCPARLFLTSVLQTGRSWVHDSTAPAALHTQQPALQFTSRMSVLKPTPPHS